MIGNDWDKILILEQKKPYFEQLQTFLNDEYTAHEVFPPKRLIYESFRLTPLESVRAVILGQDPYIKPGEAHGLAFSVTDGVKIPPSLRNVYKELNTDLGYEIPQTGNLAPWARQGVLLLNTTLTVRAGESKSHAGQGWEIFTDNVIHALNVQGRPIIFMLWGNLAREKAGMIDATRHKILQAAHPSPLARGAFFGCKHFSQANDFLTQNGQTPINWQL